MQYSLTAPKDFLVSSDTVCTSLFRWWKEGNLGEVQRKWARKRLFEKASVVEHKHMCVINTYVHQLVLGRAWCDFVALFAGYRLFPLATH